jgi:hypothetical protein
LNLVRALGIPPARKRQHDGPCAGGTFWAVADAHDLGAYGPFARADLAAMLRLGRVWLGNADRPADGWQRVSAAADLPRFRKIGVDGIDGADATTAVLPYTPQLYFVPRGWRGRRLVDRAARRAHRRALK